jgi:hypothetical protein
LRVRSSIGRPLKRKPRRPTRDTDRRGALSGAAVALSAVMALALARMKRFPELAG